MTAFENAAQVRRQLKAAGFAADFSVSSAYFQDYGREFVVSIHTPNEFADIEEAGRQMQAAQAQAKTAREILGRGNVQVRVD